MKRQKKISLALFVLLCTSPLLYGQNCDPPYILIVKPYTEIRCQIKDSKVPLDVKVNNFNLARKIYDVLSQSQYRNIIDLRSGFDEVLGLTEFIKEYSGKEFIEGTLKIIPYRPDMFLFSSIDKETDEVVLRVEILDISTKSRAVAIRKIGFRYFLAYDMLVDDEIKALASGLIDQLTAPKPHFGFISLDEYGKTLSNSTYGIGIGFGYATGNKLTLEDISSDLRRIPPHADDVKYRGPDILPVNIPDNYLVRENSVDINFGHRLSLDIMQIDLWGIVNLSIRTTSIKESGQTLNQNLYRKWYVTNNINDPDNPNSGTAYIYYGMHSSKRNYFESKSFSLPLLITYPVFYAGRNKEVIFKFLGGTNILLPDKIELESEKGWYRFGEYEIQTKSSIGDLKEIEWLVGIDMEGNLSNTLKLGIQFILIYNDYQGNFNVPISLKSEDNLHSAIRIYLMNMLPW